MSSKITSARQQKPKRPACGAKKASKAKHKFLPWTRAYTKIDSGLTGPYSATACVSLQQPPETSLACGLDQNQPGVTEPVHLVRVFGRSQPPTWNVSRYEPRSTLIDKGMSYSRENMKRLLDFTQVVLTIAHMIYHRVLHFGRLGLQADCDLRPDRS